MARQATIGVIALLLLQVAGCPQPTDDSGRAQPDPAATFRVSTSVQGQGRIQSNDSSETVQTGSTVTLLAIPSAGWRFVRWEGTTTGTDAVLVVTADKDFTLTAVFEAIPAPPPSDVDGDGIPDTSDNCPVTPNPDQADANGDGLGDACTPDFSLDFDGDGVDDSVDNCVFANPDQADSDGDGIGDACEIVLPPPVVVETVIIADDGRFLGAINDNRFDPDSVANRLGTYGNSFSSLSIWNEFATYGSEFSMLSPWNDFTISPPLIFEGDVFVAYLTTNTFRIPRIDPNELAILVGRSEETRP